MNSRLSEQFYKIKVSLLFYRSTLTINCAISLLFDFVITSAQPQTSLIDWVRNYFYIFCSMGLLCAFLYKELICKEEYYFYYNCSVSKLRLIISSFIFSVFISLILYLCLKLIM